MKSISRFFAALALTGLVTMGSLAQAATLNFSGELTRADASFHRPAAGNPPVSLGLFGWDASYDALPFYVTQTGSYRMETTSAHFSGGFREDTFLALYEGAFDPANALANVLGADDDSGVGRLSAFTRTLNAGTQYTLVVTSFLSNQYGRYTGTITGLDQGSAVAGQRGEVPTPSTLALVPLALAALALTRRRKA
jgi:hypothetical protein